MAVAAPSPRPEPEAAAAPPGAGAPSLHPAPSSPGPDPALDSSLAAAAELEAARLDDEVAALLRVDLARAAQAARRARAAARQARRAPHPPAVSAPIPSASPQPLAASAHSFRASGPAHGASSAALRASGHALRASGNVLWFQGRNRRAASLHAAAAKLFFAAGADLQAARTLSTSLQPLILLGEYHRAEAAAERARAIFQAAGEETRLARLEINVGNIYHRQDRYAEALDRYQSAYDRLRPDKDPEGIAAALANIAMCAIVANDPARAETAHLLAREHCRRANMPLGVIEADYNIAYLHYFRGDYARALDMLRAARAAAERLPDPYLAALCALDLAEIHGELNLSEEAVAMAADAERRFAALGMGYERAKALCHAGVALGQLGKTGPALEALARARDQFEEERNQVWPSLLNLYQAVVCANAGRWFEARRHARAAWEFFRSAPLPGRGLLCQIVLARLDLAAGDAASARRAAAAAARDCRRAGAANLTWQAELAWAEAEEAAGDAAAARAHFRAAQRTVESLRGRIHGEELKVSFLRNRLAANEGVVRLALAAAASRPTRRARAPRQDAIADVWLAIEQAKSRGLRDRLASPPTPAEEGKSDLARRARQLREEVNWRRRRLEAEQFAASPPSAERLREMRADAEAREREYVRALRALPRGAGGDARATRLAEMCALLPRNAAILQCFRVGDRFAGLWLAPGRKPRLADLGSRDRVADELRLLRFQLARPRLRGDGATEFAAASLAATQRHLTALHDCLLAPFREEMGRAGTRRVERLIVLPHDILHYVPFHALRRGRRYLLDDLAVSYAPSAAILARTMRASRSNTNRAALVLVVPDAANPGLEAEARAVARALPGAELLTGAAATADALRRRGAQARLLHIAAHGVFRRDNPLFSSIRLADGALTLLDLERMRLPADLIALSGCSTGLNAVGEGDELVGLTRGLLAAGARSLLLSLWDAPDAAAAQLMTDFHRRFQAGAPRVEALRAAMLATRRVHPEPRSWAPFILSGNCLD